MSSLKDSQELLHLPTALLLAAAVFSVGCHQPPTPPKVDSSEGGSSTPAASQPAPLELKTPLSPAGWAAYQTLASSNHFALGPVGIAASVPPEIPAWQVLIKEPGAAEAFRALARASNGATRAYALCGIYQVDRPSFDSLAKAAILETPNVPTMKGCIGGTEPMAKLIGSQGQMKEEGETAIYDGSTTRLLLDFADPRAKLAPSPIPTSAN